MLEIRKLEAEDVPCIAKLHVDHLSLSFPPCRPYSNLIKMIYSSFLSNQDGIGYVGTMDKKIVGYVCFHKDYRKAYTTALKNHPVGFCSNVLVLLLRFPVYFVNGLARVQRALGLSESSRRPTASDSHLWKDSYELRPIVVRKDRQGTSVANRLISRGEEALINRGGKKYFLRVRKDNTRAIAFYKKMGLTTVGDEGIRIVMVKDVKASFWS